MRLSVAVKRLREHAGMNAHQFGSAVGVSHVSILNWEDGRGVSEFSRIRLLSFARRCEPAVPREVLSAIEAAQPEVHP